MLGGFSLPKNSFVPASVSVPGAHQGHVLHILGFVCDSSTKESRAWANNLLERQDVKDPLPPCQEVSPRLGPTENSPGERSHFFLEDKLWANFGARILGSQTPHPTLQSMSGHGYLVLSLLDLYMCSLATTELGVLILRTL